ncbi:MAG: DUF2975 domain-containing protein [Eubacteriaceae bacterium]|nr:DUF2975 domain-containing protein [Eubacteriaceae bacterium]
MTQKKLSKYLCFIVYFLALAGLFCIFVLAPKVGLSMAGKYQRFSHLYYPALMFIWVCAVPFYLGLYAAYLIGKDIGRDKSFSKINSDRLRKIGIYCVMESVLIFISIVSLVVIRVLNPFLLLILILLSLTVVALSVICFALSHLVMKAARLQEENDLTI